MYVYVYMYVRIYIVCTVCIYVMCYTEHYDGNMDTCIYVQWKTYGYLPTSATWK